MPKIQDNAWFIKVNVELIDGNDGQIEGLPRNPRLIRDEKFEALKRSLQEDPEMLGLRPLMVYPYDGRFIVIGGNMRLAAMKDLGYKQAPCVLIPEDTPVEKLRAYTMKDNYGYGEWDMSILAEEWDLSELDDWDMSDILTFELSESETESGVPDFTSKNNEVNVDEFDEKITVKLQFSVDENRFVRECLGHFDSNLEKALLKALGYFNGESGNGEEE